jgi:deoxyribodipyrimidine photo-lyase
MSPSIWWIRRDLRLHDNAALQAALRLSNEVIPVWVADPALLRAAVAGEKRLAFLHQGLAALAADLEARGSRLVVRQGEPARVFASLLGETGASAVFAEDDYTPYARRRDKAVARVAPLQLLEGLAIRPPGSVLKVNGTPYTVFSAFRRAWLAQPPLWDAKPIAAPARLATPRHLVSEPLALANATIANPSFPAGETEALRRFDDFVSDGLAEYAERRDLLDEPATSALSPYLRFGMLSVRRAAAAAWAASGHNKGGARAWLDELIWRDFFIHILYHFPAVRDESFRPQFRRLPWRNDRELLDAWQEGRTGYPLVDAAMRQLAATGWIHNRARMVAASFLSKDLLVDWRLGERWFRRHLIDGDLALNNGNWQWVAGTGTDAAPYFRIFSPAAQGKKHDPAGRYVRRWLPELAGVPDRYVHEPWRMPQSLQRETGCRIGEDYPRAIIDRQQNRQRVLAFFRRTTNSRDELPPLGRHDDNDERHPLPNEILEP